MVRIPRYDDATHPSGVGSIIAVMILLSAVLLSGKAVMADLEKQAAVAAYNSTLKYKIVCGKGWINVPIYTDNYILLNNNKSVQITQENFNAVYNCSDGIEITQQH